jgi:cellulose synthase/poly-beta-1,6-N-acetylglucosamine synthase-like glycosyltransferase
VTGAMNLYQKRQNERMKSEIFQDLYIPVSIIIPAYNEETTIVDTVRSLLIQDYSVFEIVVVNDGSKDKTAECMIDFFKMRKVERPVRRVIKCKAEEAIYEATIQGVAITLVCKENGGKADSLNMGINISRYPYFICMDADSMLQKNSLQEIVKPVVEKENVVACGGHVAVSNGIILEDGEVRDFSMPKKLIVAMQVLEYECSFLASRIFLNQFNGNLIISGAFGLFKKETVFLVGGYDTSTMGEDMELVVKLHAFCKANHLDYSIEYAPDAICWSQVPSSLRDLCKQRSRWHIGLFQSLKKYTHIVAKQEYGLMGTISFLYFWIYELLSPYIEFLGIIAIIFSFSLNLINIPYMISFFVIYALFGYILTLTSFYSRHYLQKMHISIADGFKANVLCILELVGLRFILMFVRLISLIGYKKKRHIWGTMSRERHHLN